ncbi:LamG-like jellyroll fold domain-containing protein [Streptomyces sp. 3214.6]|uniref:LamG-like jellyroll fold domain-containing protein n=1 Tax=Streptomyces sp. 3214.6 TaxID=1882757 RepID=UPI00090C33F0|nr:LamG-like jellyroll fold domain-containing protein [Streptomyces sp. 3214.6]SHI49210.1 Concanavalin A-like lectin/glucanases superfamily protein [Streptomyces sp. 3214.6]
MNTYGGRRRLRAAGVVLSAAIVLAASASGGALAATGERAADTPAAKSVESAKSAGTAAADGSATAAGADGAGGGEDAKALAKAARTGKPVEITSMRGESSEVYALPEGHLEAREHLRPVRTRVDGAWRTIDTTLTRGADGTVAPGATTVGLTFSGGGSEPLVRMTKNGRELALSWPKKLPVPELNGNTVTYPEVLPGVDLRMTAQQDGFTQLLVVKSAEAAASAELSKLRLKLDADGMRVKETSDGGLTAIDQGAGSAVFEAPRPVMWDSSTKAPGAASKSTPKATTESPSNSTSNSTSTSKTASKIAGKAAAETPTATASETAPAAGRGPNAPEAVAAESGNVAAVGVDVPAAQDALVLTPDSGVLKGENTVYPVFIDPQWYSPKASAWTMASKYWASSPQWKFNGDPDAGLGYCNWSYCAPYDTKRLFYRIPTSKFAGRTVLQAEFVVRNTWSASCADRGVELWRTKDISSSTTWNSQNASGFWIDHLKTESFAYGYTGCAAKDAEFDVKSAVQQAADKKWSTMTFGMKASSESDGYAWKRFSDDAYLRVQYNRAPPQIKMSQLTMEYGGSCKKPSSAARVRSLGKIYANDVTDPDGDSVSVEFRASWDTGDGKGVVTRWKSGLTTAKKSGSDFVIGLPSSIPPDKTVSWYVHSYDGAQYSPWSYTGDPTACYFVYDKSVPKAPTISSAIYPASNPDDPDDPWYDGVGQYGDFVITGAVSDVTKYWFGLNGDPVSANTVATSGGAAKTVPVLPLKPGLNTFTARSFDAAGNGSEIRTYQFRVKSGQLERADWSMDEAAGATQAAGSAPEQSATLYNGPTPNVEGKFGKAVQFDGVDDYAATDIATINTDVSFSVSAWVKLSAMPSGAAVVASQRGNNAPGFELYYSKGYDRWVFNQYSADSTSGTPVRAMQAAAGGVKAGEWTHLVGEYAAGEKLLKLYVNGALAGTTAYSTPWNARRGMVIGGSFLGGTQASPFPGAIDEVKTFEKPLSAGEVSSLYSSNTIGSGRPARAVFHMDDAADATALSGRADVNPAVLKGGATTGSAGVDGNALTLDGTDDYAVTAGPHINTSYSFAVSAWVKLPKTKPTHAATVATQIGDTVTGPELYYSSSYDRWVFNQHSADTADSTVVRAMQPDGVTAYGGEWTHLVGVQDTEADKLSLYVNGTLAGTTALPTTWYAGGAMQFGASAFQGAATSFFPGQIDDVRLFDRPVSAGEVQQLFKQRAVVKGRWKFETATGAPLTSPDASSSGNAMTLYNGAQTGSGWVDGAVALDGTDDYAAASVVPVDTSASFTVSAYVQAAATPTGPVTVMSAPGAKKSAFAVRYEPSATPATDPGRWRIATADSDSDSAAVSDIGNGMFYSPTDWNHLALVYDGFSKEVRLYVNGELQETACADADDDGVQDDASCTDTVSWSDDVLTYKAAKTLQLGRDTTGTTSGQYFPGSLSDVWVFQGALTETQIDHLAVGMPGVDTAVPSGD